MRIDFYENFIIQISIICLFYVECAGWEFDVLEHGGLWIVNLLLLFVDTD